MKNQTSIHHTKLKNNQYPFLIFLHIFTQFAKRQYFKQCHSLYLQFPPKKVSLTFHLMISLKTTSKIIQNANTLGTSCSSICKKCLQFFANEHKVQQHQQKEKKHCTAAQFLLKVISCYPKYKTFIQAMDTGIQNLSIFDFLVYALSANPTYLPMVESKPIGISGQLVLAVAQQFHIMQPQSILHFIGDMPVTYEDIHRVLSGIMFDITDPTANSFESFRAGDNWIEGNQIEMIRALLYEDRFYTENGELKPVMITPSFYTILCSDTFDACSWLKSCFRRLNLLIESNFYLANV